MAVSTSTISSFASIGVPGACSNFDLYESTTNPKRPVGFKVEDVQGNIYRWAHFGATTTQGKLVSQDLSESSYVDTDNAILAPASCVNTTDNSVGSRYVEITLGSITANQFAGGKLLITDDTGEGYTYDIIGNTATGNPASGTFRLELARPLQAALDATSDFMISGSKWANLEPALGVGVGNLNDVFFAGVSMASQAADDYGWICTKGIVGILTNGSPLVGSGVVPSGTTAGAVDIASSSTTGRLVGSCILDGDSTGYALCDINCE
jgi:hypothetical protein